MNAEEMFDGKVIRAKYIVEHYIESGITTWIFIPEEKKEIKMSETNLEHYKEQLKEIYNEYFDEPSDVLDKIINDIDSGITTNASRSYTDDILDWMARPYKEPILDEAEKEYLSEVIKPFRDKVKFIKLPSYDCLNLIYTCIRMYDKFGGEIVRLPNFKIGTMYKGMGIGREYTLEELGL